MNTNLHCPHCQQIDNVRKVSALVNAGTSSGSYTGYADGVGYTPNGPVVVDDYITLNASSQTNLSRLLSPPAQPTHQSAWSDAWVGTVVVLWFLLSIPACYFLTSLR